MMINLEFLIVLIGVVIVGNLFTIATIVMAKDLFWNKIEDEEEEEEEEEDIPENNLLECIGEDENGNGIYKFK